MRYEDLVDWYAKQTRSRGCICRSCDGGSKSMAGFMLSIMTRRSFGKTCIDVQNFGNLNQGRLIANIEGNAELRHIHIK